MLSDYQHLGQNIKCSSYFSDSTHITDQIQGHGKWEIEFGVSNRTLCYEEMYYTCGVFTVAAARGCCMLEMPLIQQRCWIFNFTCTNLFKFKQPHVTGGCHPGQRRIRWLMVRFSRRTADSTTIDDLSLQLWPLLFLH